MGRNLGWELDVEALEGPADMVVCGEETRRGASISTRISSRPSTAFEATHTGRPQAVVTPASSPNQFPDDLNLKSAHITLRMWTVR